MSKLIRNLDTSENIEFWKDCSSEVDNWPAWKRAGINVAQMRKTSRIKMVKYTENRFQNAEMVALLNKIADLEQQQLELIKLLRQKCSHLKGNGKSAFGEPGLSFSYCELCGERD